MVLDAVRNRLWSCSENSMESVAWALASGIFAYQAATDPANATPLVITAVLFAIVAYVTHRRRNRP